MPPIALFGISIAFSFVAWSLVTVHFIWPQLRGRSRVDALRPLLILHAFRFVGLSFLIPGVVSPDLPAAFAFAAAYGDIVAAILALLSLAVLRSSLGIPLVWIFNVWGSIDLLDAFYQANAHGLLPGQLGAAYFIPTAIVPFLLIAHVLMFRLLLQKPAAAGAPVEAHWGASTLGFITISRRRSEAASTAALQSSLFTAMKPKYIQIKNLPVY
jgi:hypothetical protein